MTIDQLAASLSAVVFFVMMCFGAIVTMLVGRLWFQAHLSGVNLMMIDILRMRLRRTDARAVIQAIITAKQGGVDVSCKEMEQALLQGVDLRKITLALIEARKQGLEITLQELVDADLSDQLEEKLHGKQEERDWQEPICCESR